ncbi:MAG: 1-deoxy-D-xylulose-5-phosphate reductoisomerase [Rhodobiaceae bacterium]|nr:1-deoxy-D-xylulose-5-phosphate reductoisomerase [Rhodobiaceae bacterium]MCC0013091.1 1-deoxy-D-xylulose-5-phosphate reductoisomerase [Rhodobiaceae bacterium]MCC0019239.1 1-deoxy-D-xylulose-5-phosphate reductoisomerase [Rhodobiaceae bacterium]MCC0062288.1 1-deoxy-D-xylulose-5-phosphate reductoisomerase [Rhodobiaceae bacterium]
MTHRRITILGATGSVGGSTLDLVGGHEDRFSIDTLTAHRDVGGLAGLARKYRARHAVIADASLKEDLVAALAGSGITAEAGPEALCEAAMRPVDLVMAAIVGVAGLAPTLAAVRSQPVVALANKETLVCAGAFFMNEVARSGTLLLPVDSEHSALLQALGGPAFMEKPDFTAVEELVITGSGGPFRTLPEDDLERVTPQQAVAHPVWSMGSKISVDSATLMNKALELIEAKHLFSIHDARLKVLIHPQSIIHGLVRFKDGSVVAQMAQPDMRVPIAMALAWPERIMTRAATLDLAELASLTFERPDEARFPALRLARELLSAPGGGAAIANAANEYAVDAFLAGRIRFTDIVRICEETLLDADGFSRPAPANLEEALSLDAEGRRIAAVRASQSGSGAHVVGRVRSA